MPSEYATINGALDASSPGDTVLVAPGTYTDSEARDLGIGPVWWSCAFMADGVVLRSEDGAQVTTIDMGGPPGPQAYVVNSMFNLSVETAVEGFTITGGLRGAFVIGAMIFRDCLFHDLDVGGSTGAGISAQGNVRIERCEFVDCVASDLGGGAIFHANGHLDLIDSVVRQCGSRGIDLSGDAGPPLESAWIENCLFVENWANVTGGAIGISNYGNGATIRGCVFERNVAHGTGGGAIAWGNYGPKVIEDCLFIGNGTDGDNGQGGAVKLSGTPPATIAGCTFYGNYQTNPFLGGATITLYTDGVLNNSVVVGSAGHEAVFVESGQLVTTGCNVYWDNPEGIGIPLSQTDMITDPYFCNPAAGNFTVRGDSPCLPGGSGGCGQIGAFGRGCGVVRMESWTWSRIKAAHRGP